MLSCDLLPAIRLFPTTSLAYMFVSETMSWTRSSEKKMLKMFISFSRTVKVGPVWEVNVCIVVTGSKSVDHFGVDGVSLVYM